MSDHKHEACTRQNAATRAFIRAVYLADGRNLGRSENEADRVVCLTPFLGNYGRAGVVVAIEGSPPRGTFIVFNQSAGDPAVDAILYYYQGRTLTLINWQTLQHGYSPRSRRRRLADAIMLLLRSVYERD